MSESNEPPLRGVRVLDLTRLVPGPVCTQHLADLGADVIKVEDTGAGDYAPPALRAIVNRNKRGLQLDLKQPAGAAALLQLARDAHVLVEGFRPGAMARLGLGYDDVAAVNPGIVYCSLTGYGQSGPYRDRAGHDINYCGHAGVADQVGVDAHTPALSNLPLADLMGGALTAVMGIMAALFDAARSGRGRYVDIAMADGALAHAVMPLATLAAHGSTRRAGADTLTGGLACYALYRTADKRFLAVGALERKFWDALCDVIERPDLKAQHRSGDAAAQARLRSELAAILGGQTLAYWEPRFARADCCVTPVHTLEEALADPHFRARGMVFDSTHPGTASITQLASPVKMSRFEFALHRPAPRAGEHTVELLREAGLDEATIGVLLEKVWPARRSIAAVTHHTIAIHHVEQVLQGADRRGVATAPLLRRAGIPEALLQAPLARVSQDQYARLLRVVQRALRDEFWGLCSRPLPLGSFAQCCRLLIHTPTLAEALRVGFRYFHGQLPDFVARLGIADGLASVRIVTPQQAEPSPQLQYAERTFLFFTFGLASWLAARRIPLVNVDYRGAAPPNVAETARVFQARVRHGQPHFGLCFEARWLQLPMVQNTQSLREFLHSAPANLLVKYRDKTSATERIRRLLRSHLRGEMPSLEEVGRALGMTPQTLRRRLAEDGQGFQSLKDNLRRDAAIEYLARPDMTLLDIADQLGFSEASTFHRAFKKWTGVAPGEYRHRHR